MPNRIIREAINDSERVDALCAPSEIFYRRVLNVVDDYGRFDARPAVLIAACYPLRAGRMAPEEIERALRECTAGERPLIIVYDVNGKRFLEVQDFRQQIRSNKSKYPDPRAADAQRVMFSCAADATQKSDAVPEIIENNHAHQNCSAPAKQVSSDCALNPYPYPYSYICASDDARSGDAHSTQEPFDLSPEPINNAQVDPPEAWFEKFWAAYSRWRNRDRKRAHQVFMRVVKTKAIFETIIAAIEAQSPEMMRRPADKRPHASTWLNGSRWEDEFGGPGDEPEDDDQPRGPRLMM